MPPLSSQDVSRSIFSTTKWFSRRSSALSIPPRLFHSHSLSSPIQSATKAISSAQLLARTLPSVLRRQVDPNILPTTYSGVSSGPPPGTVVGIVLGSVGGFLLLLWLIYTCFNMQFASGSVYGEEVVRRRSSRSHSPRRAASSRSRSEIIEVQQHQRQRSPRREVRRETVIVEETHRPPSRAEDDIVEVIEDPIPPPQRRERRSSDRREGYFRTIDPDAYGGGRAPARKVRR